MGLSNTRLKQSEANRTNKQRQQQQQRRRRQRLQRTKEKKNRKRRKGKDKQIHKYKRVFSGLFASMFVKTSQS